MAVHVPTSPSRTSHGPSLSSKLFKFTVCAFSISLVHWTKHSARRFDMPNFVGVTEKLETKPRHHVSARSLLPRKRDYRCCAQYETYHKCCAVLCLGVQTANRLPQIDVVAKVSARYWVNLPRDVATHHHVYEADETPKDPDFVDVHITCQQSMCQSRGSIGTWR